jgi:DNA-directed RNA polymerase subunit H (RpoH/RPB5)
MGAFDNLDMFEDKKVKIDQLPEISISGLATQKQRGYIKGLCKQMGIERSELPKLIDELTVAEAKEYIDLMRDGILPE